MISLANQKFWKAFDSLPIDIQQRAKEAYRLWHEDPYHESLQTCA
jgi:hypothetical protein